MRRYISWAAVPLRYVTPIVVSLHSPRPSEYPRLASRKPEVEGLLFDAFKIELRRGTRFQR